MNAKIQFNDHDALLVVDMQNDFCPGGALAVPQGDAVIPVLNEAIAEARKAGVPIFASRDWHTVDHVSFEQQGGPWPVHCVQDTDGARYHPDVDIDDRAIRISKGTRFDKDAYSAFDNTGLGYYLKQRGVKRVWIGGLAQDVCVLKTTLASVEEGFETFLMQSATRPVDPQKGDEAIEEMRRAGAHIVD